MTLIRLFLLLTAIVVLQWLFLSWVFGRGAALNILELVLALVIVQITAEHFGVSPEWIVFVDFTLVTTTVAYWHLRSGAASWNVLFSVIALIGLTGIGLVGYKQGYPDVWIAKMDGLLLFVLCLITFIRAIGTGQG
ncbi:MAG: hypothetical protein D6803_06410 [Anaerolineae bacterium]|nr:MAG: hypothetical protein D6803_06410 [Anaerolineae bacterium]